MLRFHRTADKPRWALGTVTFVLTAVLAATLTYWAIQLLSPRVSIAPGGSIINTDGGLDLRPAGRLFGTAGAGQVVQATPLPSNIQVIGLIAAESRAAVILTVDGQAPAAYGVGDTVDGQLTVQSVTRDEVVLERDGEIMRAPAPAVIDTAILSAGASGERAGGDTEAPSRNPIRRQASASGLPPLPPSGASAAPAQSSAQAAVSRRAAIGQPGGRAARPATQASARVVRGAPPPQLGQAMRLNRQALTRPGS